MRTIQRETVSAFIISSDEKILLGKSVRGTYEGLWITPGGGIEAGETKEEALNREVYEELKLDISDVEKEFIGEIFKGESRKVLKDTGEKVLGKYTFYNYVLRFDKNSDRIHYESMDDFYDATWHDVSSLNKIPLPPASVMTLKKLGYL